MKKKWSGKRTLLAILSLFLVFSVLPFTGGIIAASEDPIYVLAGGDFQAGDNGQADHYYSKIHVANILNAIKKDHSHMDGFLFVGDYDGDTHNDSNATTGIAALMDTVDNTYSNLNHDNSILLQGNHESNQVPGIDPTGGYEFDGYAVYVMNQADYCERQTGKGTQIEQVAKNLETWLNDKLGEGYDAPIFVTTHVPLAYGTRTYTNGDGLYAKYIFDVLNTAADNGLNIIFMHGHDHAYGADNYLGGEAIYLPVGDKINIAVPGDKANWTEETLNFTYMNAGYVGYYNENYYNVNSYEEEKLTMTVFKIENNQVTIERYNKNGLYDLKKAGREGFYANGGTCAGIGLDYNTTVYTSPQTITLGAIDTSNYGTIGEWIEVEGTITNSITPNNKGWVEIVKPVPGTTTGGTTNYQYTQDTNGVNTNTGYLMVNSSKTVGMDNNGTSGFTTVSLTNGVTGKMIADSRDYEWKFDDNNRIYTTINGTNYYINVNGTTLSLVTGRQYGNTYYVNATEWDISNNKGQYTISSQIQTGSWYNPTYTTYYLTETGISSTSGTVRLYSYEKDIVTGATTTKDQNGTYGKIVGDLTYNATKGMTAEEAMALVKNGIDGYYYEAMSEPGNSVTGTKVDDAQLTWEWVNTFNSNVPGEYGVKISYKHEGEEFELGIVEVVVPATSTYYIAEGNGMYFVDMNTTEANALATVKEGVTVSSATDKNGTNKTLIDDSNVTWKWIDTYNGGDSGPYTLEVLYNGTSLGTVEVKVNIKYETGLNDSWTNVGKSEVTGSTHTYTLDTNGIDAGSNNKYIIVARNQAYLLDAGKAVPVTISSDGKTITTTTRDYEYYFTGSTGGLITRDGSNTLYQQNWGIHTGNIADSNLDMFTNNGSGYYRIYDGDGRQRSLYFDGSGWTVTSENHTSSTYTVRLYKYTGSTGGTGGIDQYAKLTGNTDYTVDSGTSKNEALSIVKKGITGYLSSSSNGTDPTEIPDGDLEWTWKNTYTGNVVGSYWIDISYKGKVLGTVVVHVKPGIINNYPEYPDEGSVKVNKTGTGIDFQSSGIAQVEVSASGIPLKKGIDVIIMVDTSSSMKSWCICGTQNCTSTGTGHARRNVVFEESLESLIAQLKSKNDDETEKDIRVALADFNGFNGYNNSTSYGSPYDRDENDTTNDTNWYSADNQAKIYTGTKELSAGAFVQASELPEDSADFGFNYVSGTNYDYAFDAVYQLGNSIKDANAMNGENRDLYVVFMSDGAPMQYNYYHSQGNSTNWQYWITGTVESNGGFSKVVNCQEHTYYYDESNGNKHRMAEAIKGSPLEQYEVIRKSKAGLEDVLTATNEENMYKVPGLGATMFSIAFDPVADGNTPASAMTHVLEHIASEQTESTKYYYLADSASDLSNAFNSIGNAIAYAATNARVVDQMGDAYSLQMKTSTYSVVDGTTTKEKTLKPKIEIINYDIYTRQDYLNGDITEDKIGDRKGTYTILETVTFSDDGKEAYSDHINGGKTNILADGTQAGYVKGVIYAKTFLYNTNATEVTVDGVNIPTGINVDKTTKGSSNVLPAETFYWKIGTVQTSELAMRYHVYLDGSMEGTRKGGSYPTNEYAILYYDNYLNNPCYKETVSPVLAWKEANVSYAFYLVNKDGEIIVNQTTGQTGSFANKVAVTSPVVYETVLLNSDEEVSSIDIASLGVLPDGYTLYDCEGTGSNKTGATYTVKINSNTTGSWEITSVKDVATTYVMQYNPNDAAAYSNALNTSTVGYDYTHTIVWFAVLWEVQALPDAVVVDYGLPVDISVLDNDMFGENGKLAGIGSSNSVNLEGHDANLATGFTTNYTGTYGTAKADLENGKVRYSLNTMAMDNFEKFAYAAQYTGNENAGYYYDTVTVIPATTIYYEDDFLTYKSFKADNTEITDSTSKYAWTTEGEKDEDAKQDEDRPGKYSLPHVDANNVYGHDNVNNNCSTYSLGAAKKVHVDANSYATATFSFAGTGFDVVGLTSNKTGALAAKVVNDVTGKTVKTIVVNTYYGYTFNETDGWVPTTSDDPNAIYQVPVIQAEDLPYGRYTVTLTATYADFFDKTGTVNTDGKKDGYDLYVDAIRIYDPANDGKTDSTNTILNAYKADNEGWPAYHELRDELISRGTFEDSVHDESGNVSHDPEVEGVVFIDGKSEVKDADLADYVSYGPNNEVYLNEGQSVVFNLNLGTSENIADVQIGLKSATSTPVKCNIYNAVLNNQQKVDKLGEKTYLLNTSTDMYYSIYNYRKDAIVITNNSDSGIVSITNIKVTYKEEPGMPKERSLFYVNRSSVGFALRAINYVPFNPSVFEGMIEMPKVTVGESATYTVTTSSDVEYLMVEDKQITEYKEDANGNRIWDITIETSEVGEKSVEVYAYNKDGEACENTITATVKAEEKIVEPSIKVEGDDVIVSTGNNVSSVIINGNTINDYTEEGNNRIWKDTLEEDETDIKVEIFDEDGNKIDEMTESTKGMNPLFIGGGLLAVVLLLILLMRGGKKKNEA